MTKHEAVKEYFEKKVMELIGKTMNFNFSDEEGPDIAFVTNYSDRVIKKYIRAGADKEYGFSIIITARYSTDEDDLNMIAMNFAQKFMDWIEQQDKEKIYPQFPENCQIKKMEVLQNMPNLAGINAKEGLARYMVQSRIVYFEREVKK